MSALLTHLVFDHALRMRVTAETSDSAAIAGTTTAQPSDTLITEAGVETQNTESSTSSEEAIPSTSTTSSSMKGKQPAKNVDAKLMNAEDTVVGNDAAKNLMGRLNNLVTTDLENIANGREFVFFGASP